MNYFNEYQRLTNETAVYPELHSASYLLLGLGEAGEIQGKIKKIIRYDKGIVTDEKRNAISKELGDFLWYFAQYSNLLGFMFDGFFNLDELQKDLEDQEVIEGEFNFVEPATLLGHVVGEIQLLGFNYRNHPNERDFLIEMKRQFNFIGRIVLVLCHHLNLSIEQVLKENLDKLSDRKERGTIQGSGDNR